MKKNSFNHIKVVLIVSVIVSGGSLTGSAGNPDTSDIYPILEGHISVIEEVLDHLKNGNRDQAKAMFTQMEESLEILATWSRHRQNIARAITVRTASDEEPNLAASEFQQATQPASSARLELPMNWLAYTEGTMPSETLTGKTEELLDSHKQLISTGRQLRQHQENVELPLMGGIYGPDQITSSNGTSIEAEFMLENYGNDRFHSLNIWVESARGNEPPPLEISPDNVSSLDPGNVIQFTISGQAGQLDDEMFYLTVEGDQYREQKLIRINPE